MQWLKPWMATGSIRKIVQVCKFIVDANPKRRSAIAMTENESAEGTAANALKASYEILLGGDKGIPFKIKDFHAINLLAFLMDRWLPPLPVAAGSTRWTWSQVDQEF